ncbi:MAG: thioredoxin [Mobiluncus porci]|uniref:Thioredoxin n=1 Tax=Mobiluncus porci TaxID=2652278 RepID=A0A7K0K0T0_9ACTO|nr:MULTISPECIES: thioredoxin [Mobiluncus]MCI6583566.1 thioredoxin [Mobiluncus sp.]MDD7540944.1 thioredoxin [Mobiluncus porci]MDY5748973.1 thioredoxin [Mobiluncus porci]MST49091.1 thioredoxin [Mobiluncus porci]
MSNAPEVGESNFHTEVLESDLPVLVDFWAVWCPPCRQMGPIIDQIATEFGDKLKVVKCDVDNNPSLQAKYQISSIPTFNIYKDGEVAAQFIGGRPKAQFRREIESVIG